MRFETLKSSKKKYFLYVLVVGVALLLPLILTVSRAKYRTTQSIKIVEGTIRNYSPADLNILAIKVQNGSGEYDSSNTIPESGYVLNETESYCTIPDGNGGTTTDTSIPMEYKDGKVYIGVNTKGTKCYLYFDKKPPENVQELIATHTIATRTDFSSIVTADTTGTLYTADDDDGTSYYFAGNPTDNWVKFAGMYWRIIRINGDGTIRMIYQGTAANTTGTGTQTTTSAFNSSFNNNMYVGYMYTSGSAHGLGTPSTIKGVLDSWYDSNLASYASYIDANAGFCGDRTSTTTQDGAPNDTGGTGTTQTFYGAKYRLHTNKTPSLKCTYSSDLYTLSSSSKGNKALTKPIGLITADEVAYAGGKNGSSNSSYYLYTGKNYWTMSPWHFYGSRAWAFLVLWGGLLDGGWVNDAYGVRPVINLKAGTAFTGWGNGTAENPYVVQ